MFPKRSLWFKYRMHGRETREGAEKEGRRPLQKSQTVMTATHIRALAMEVGFLCVGSGICRPFGGVGTRDRVVKHDSQVSDFTTKSAKVLFYQDGEDQRSASCQRNTKYPFSDFALDLVVILQTLRAITVIFSSSLPSNSLPQAPILCILNTVEAMPQRSIRHI